MWSRRESEKRAHEAGDTADEKQVRQKRYFQVSIQLCPTKHLMRKEAKLDPITDEDRRTRLEPPDWPSTNETFANAISASFCEISESVHQQSKQLRR